MKTSGANGKAATAKQALASGESLGRHLARLAGGARCFCCGRPTRLVRRLDGKQVVYCLACGSEVEEVEGEEISYLFGVSVVGFAA